MQERGNAMFEKVNPSHPDKIADRIAGAIVDLAYATTHNPKIAVEVLIGHGKCHIIAESSVRLRRKCIRKIVRRMAGFGRLQGIQARCPSGTKPKACVPLR